MSEALLVAAAINWGLGALVATVMGIGHHIDYLSKREARFALSCLCLGGLAPVVCTLIGVVRTADIKLPALRRPDIDPATCKALPSARAVRRD
jgi:hypothetical protein